MAVAHPDDQVVKTPLSRTIPVARVDERTDRPRFDAVLGDGEGASGPEDRLSASGDRGGNADQAMIWRPAPGAARRPPGVWPYGRSLTGRAAVAPRAVVTGQVTSV
jgi:hypothetical protein